MSGITVHHFNVDSSPPPSIRLLETAQRLVDAATAVSPEWRSIIPIASVASRSSSGSPAGAYFVWRRVPPAIDRSVSTVQGEPELYDWDAPMEDNVEIINLKTLPEFEETDLRDIICHPKSRFAKRTPRSDSPPHSRSHVRSDVDSTSVTKPGERLSSPHESLSPPATTISISRLIPFVRQPHYYESPDPVRPPPPGINNIPAFRVARSLSPSVSLTTPFARTAWLVPLRGVPPVEGASPAQLDSTLSCKQLSQDASLPLTIQWTPAAVTQFWTFLLRQRSTNNFGPIALAYMFPPHSTPKDRRTERVKRRNKKFGEGNIYREGMGELTQKQGNGSILVESHCDESAEVSVWEYIKIYHDSQYAMKLRSLLDSFRWEENTEGVRGGTVGDLPPIQHRILKATRLVLVDETGNAILLA